MLCENCENRETVSDIDNVPVEGCKVCCNQTYPGVQEGDILCPACSLVYHRCEKCGEDLGIPTILVSINPEWWELIKSGEKTMEVRKTAPKKFTSFNALCYVTHPVGAIMGGFHCSSVEKTSDPDTLNASLHMIPKEKLHNYIKKGKICYGWYISDVTVFPSPLYLSDIGESRAPMSWKFLDLNIDDDSINPPPDKQLESDKYEDAFYHPTGRKSRQDVRADALASLPLPYSDKKMDNDERKFGWSILPTSLIPLLNNDMTLSENTIRLMCDADRRHADYDVGYWSTDSYNSEGNISLVLISCCIKDDIDQTLGELALRVAFIRKLPFLEVARHLVELRRENKLGYFKTTSEGDFYYAHWYPASECRRQEIGGLPHDLQSLLFCKDDISSRQ